jgi:hypothetical protein
MIWTMKVRSIREVPNTMGRYVHFAPTRKDDAALRAAGTWVEAQTILDRYKPSESVALSYSEH